MQIAIIGGHGQIARPLARTLHATGHRVRGLVRAEEQFGDLRDDGTEPVHCDLEAVDDTELDAALAGADVVVFAAGAGPGSGPERKELLDRDGAIKSVESAARIGAGRFVIVSSMGADSPPSGDETFSVYLRAKHDADVAVREISNRSGMAHTIIRPGRLTDDPPDGRVQLAERAERAEIPREDVAGVLAELIESGRGAGLTLELVSGDRSIADAVASLA